MADEIIYQAVIYGFAAPFTWTLHRTGGAATGIVQDPAGGGALERCAPTYRQALEDAHDAAVADYEEWLHKQARKVEDVFRAPAVPPRGHDELLRGLPVREPVRTLAAAPEREPKQQRPPAPPRETLVYPPILPPYPPVGDA